MMEFNEQMLSKSMQPLSGSAIRAIFHLLQKPGMISFAGGNPALSALEPDVIGELAVQALREYGPNLLQYGGTEGFPLLRQEIPKFVADAGISTSPEMVLPTQGSQQALDLLCKALIDPGDVILVESPTFLGALQTMKTYGAKLVPMPMDEHGVIPSEVEALVKAERPKFIYVIPTFQNPTGKTLSLERRKELARIANEHGVVLAEDDPYRDLRYAGAPLPAIKSFDENGWVVYLGSFSKLISPGLRVGYAIVDIPQLMRKMVIGKQSADVHSPLLNQATVGLYLKQGLMPGHLERICGSYRAQLDKMLEGLDAWPEGVRYVRPVGGLFVWVELPEGMSASEMLMEATDRGVAYVSGTHFYCGGEHDNTLRLNFSNSELPVIEKGMAILGGLMKEKIG